MKKYNYIISTVILLFGLSVLTSFNSDDDESPADRLIGTWNVEDLKGSKVVGEYTAVITKKDKDNITIISDREKPPSYHMKKLVVKVNWDEMRITKSGTTVKGKIKDENDFQITYAYGGLVVSVVDLHFTRQE